MRKEAQLNIEEEIIAENQSRNVVDTGIEMIVPGTAPVNSVPVNPVTEQPAIISCEKHADQASAMLLSTMREKADNRAFRHLYSCRKYIGGIIVFCKRVVRKCLKWYIEPVCDQQSDFNHATVAMTEKLFDELASVNTVTSNVQSRLNTFESRLRMLEESQQNWAEGLRRAIDVQRERVDRLEGEVGAQRERAERLEDEVGAQRERAERLEDEVGAQRERADRLEGEVGAQRERADRLENEVGVQRERADRLQDEVGAQCERADRLENEVGVQRERADRLEDEVGAQRECADRLEEEAGAQRERADRLEEEASTQRERADRLEEEAGAQRERADRLEDEVSAQRERADRMERAFDEQRPRYSFGEIMSHSQSGEDTIVAYILDSLKIPFNQCTYLDLGANHPKAMSNSYMLYRFGARGVLVEANPTLVAELERERKGDVILNKCVAEKSGEYVDFYIMNGDGLSTPEYCYAIECMKKNPSLRIEQVVPVETIAISDLLEQYFRVPPMLVNIDVEGNELELLRDLELENKRPLIVIVETIPYDPRIKTNNKNKAVIDYMKTMEYEEYAFTGINSIFVDTKRLPR